MPLWWVDYLPFYLEDGYLEMQYQISLPQMFRLLRLEQAISEEAMQISILVRLSPLIPDEWLNYVMASGPVSTRVFVISNMSSLVYSIAYAYFGYVAGKIVLSGDGLSGFKDSPSGYIMLIIGVIASVIVTVIIMRITMKALDTKIAVE